MKLQRRAAWPVLATLAAFFACNQSPTGPSITRTPSAPAPSTPSIPSSLSGTVYGLGIRTPVELPDATVEVADAMADDGWDSAARARTDANGRYAVAFSAHAPDYAARVRKEGYQDLIVLLGRVTPPMTHDFYLVPASAAKLVLGQAVTQTIGPADPQCSPDAQLSEFGGPCQEFAASVPASGTLRVTLSWSNPDATFVVYARGAGSQETYGDASPLSVSFTLDANATAAIIVQLQASSRVAAPQTYTLEVS